MFSNGDHIKMIFYCILGQGENSNQNVQMIISSFPDTAFQEHINLCRNICTTFISRVVQRVH